MRSATRVLILGWLFVCLAGQVYSNESKDDEQSMRFFESRIRPLLIERCYECHAEDESEGGLRLDLQESLSEGGDSGPAVVAGAPEQSLLMSAVRYEELEMPPDEPLSADQQRDLERWIKHGAYWPKDLGHATESDAEDQSWWAAEPLNPGQAPEAIPYDRSDTQQLDTGGGGNAIDRHIGRQLAEAGLSPSPPIDRTRLIRRLTYDLMGLPSSPREIQKFRDDRHPTAYRRLVDRTLANPAYGERMARKWLDVVRYAESDGYRADGYRPSAWRYRDWVIDAMNQGMPYDEFVTMQVAGDEVAPGAGGNVAAGFYRLGIYEYNQRDAEGHWQTIVDELTDVTADVFMATGMACAKCHDHKFDPIPRADYFRLRSVFEPLVFVDQRAATKPSDQLESLLAKLRELEGDAVSQLGRAAVVRFPDEIIAMYDKPANERDSYESQMAYLVSRQVVDEGLKANKVKEKLGKEAAAERDRLLKKLRALNADPYAQPAVMTIGDATGEIRPTRLPGRTSGRSFQPGIPEIFGGQDLQLSQPMSAPQSTGRRSALARWLTSPDNPITPRVIVNRLWQYHFGTGLVSSPNDFGRLGSPPTHPRLLDTLALELIDSGWDLKRLQRQLVLSRTYRQSSVHPDQEQGMLGDAQNRLLWHHPVRRLDAEQFRDSLLVSMGTLRRSIGGPSQSGAPPYRSIYMQRKRNQMDEMLGTLDAPTGVVGTAKRDVTITAPQTLMLLNNSRLISVANKIAEQTCRDLGQTAKASSITHDQAWAFVDHAHELVTGMPIETIEDQALVDALVQLASKGQSERADVCHVLINSNAFLFVE
ncbi:MAG: PSD1 and planctomycete cytochrome C domain-containing protein [Planctomycetota bacterium]